MSYSTREALNFVAEINVPVTAPLVASLSRAAPFTVRLDAVAMVNAALFARLSISGVVGAVGVHRGRVLSVYPQSRT